LRLKKIKSRNEFEIGPAFSGPAFSVDPKPHRRQTARPTRPGKLEKTRTGKRGEKEREGTGEGAGTS